MQFQDFITQVNPVADRKFITWSNYAQQKPQSALALADLNELTSQLGCSNQTSRLAWHRQTCNLASWPKKPGTAHHCRSMTHTRFSPQSQPYFIFKTKKGKQYSELS